MHSWRAVQSKSSVWTCDRNVSCSCLLLSGIEIFRPLREICVPPWRCWTVERELCVHWPWRWSIEDLNCRAIESCASIDLGVDPLKTWTVERSRAVTNACAAVIRYNSKQYWYISLSITISNKSLFHYIKWPWLNQYVHFIINSVFIYNVKKQPFCQTQHKIELVYNQTGVTVSQGQ